MSKVTICPNCQKPSKSGGPHRGALRAMAGENPRDIIGYGCGTIPQSDAGASARKHEKRLRRKRAREQALIPTRGVAVVGTGKISASSEKTKSKKAAAA